MKPKETLTSYYHRFKNLISINIPTSKIRIQKDRKEDRPIAYHHDTSIKKQKNRPSDTRPPYQLQLRSNSVYSKRKSLSTRIKHLNTSKNVDNDFPIYDSTKNNSNITVTQIKYILHTIKLYTI